MSKLELIDELRRNGAVFCEAQIVFITRDSTGQIVWLEQGNAQAGLRHILGRHADDFKKALGLLENEIPIFLEKAVSLGTIVSNNISRGGTGYTRVYDYDGKYFTVTAIGTNGFIVTAYPTPKEVRL